MITWSSVKTFTYKVKLLIYPNNKPWITKQLRDIVKPRETPSLRDRQMLRTLHLDMKREINSAKVTRPFSFQIYSTHNLTTSMGEELLTRAEVSLLPTKCPRGLIVNTLLDKVYFVCLLSLYSVTAALDAVWTFS